MKGFLEFIISWQGIGVIYIINILLVLTIIFAERKSPSATLAWIMFLTFIPVVGFFFYLILNQNISRYKINKLTEKETRIIGGVLHKQIDDMDRGDYEFESRIAEKWRHMIKLNQVYGSSFYSERNKIEMFVDGKVLSEKIREDILSAKKTINVEYYIVNNDRVGRAFIALLTEKAKEGVEVRMLVDSIGSRFIGNRALKDYLKAGGKVGYFFKPKFKIFGLKINYRNHRKIMVIDNKVAYTGGFNVGREYVGEKKKFGYWRDSHARVVGEAVTDINSRFILDWRFTTGEKMDVLEAGITESIPKDSRPIGVQVISCGPESPREEVKRAFMKMITSAQKNVYLQTPYFVPDDSILESLKMATQSGVDVRVMIPCKPDHVFVYWATYSYVGELLKSGARVFVYDNGFLHAKTLVTDGEVGTIGSTNFDNRSFRLNFETNLFVYDEGFAEGMEKVFETDMEKSHELTLDDYNRRPVGIRIKEAFSRLVSDVL